ncbi:metallophosphoesterase [Heliorestis acidaminivorans]|uniref:Metallophosphoesterase n=1 Tax=Heliorestis acidaminivorans TaxID=553427 RepID=A0A6I0F9S1_9FIRM|nr:metallophosphoesterase [Heliorestis acidaminivorans]KAB2954288.1 metallophosphoesterase [Heliorestis acidaminivorans]
MALRNYLSRPWLWLYGFLFFSLAIAYPLGRLLETTVPSIAIPLIVIGGYWLAIILYMGMMLLLIEILRLIHRFKPFIPVSWTENRKTPLFLTITVVALTALIILYGSWNAHNPRITSYEIPIAKSAGPLEELKIVVVSDLHLGNIVKNDRLLKMVNMVKELDPDLILLPGDIIDEDPGPFAEQDMKATFGKLNPPYGIFAALGNHEYIGGHWEDIIVHLEEAGVTVLQDEYKKVDDRFYIVGRDDRSRHHFAGSARKSLAEVMTDVEQGLPILLMDHQPLDLEEAVEQGVDLQVSGHTHRGQLFPFNFVTHFMFETDWGHLKKGDSNFVVSTGYGTWGPPIRTGNWPEVVEITLYFGKVREE